MKTDLVKPARGGFLRPFGCGWFIKEFLSGNAPFNSPVIDPETGSPQADIFYHYKHALIRETATDKAIKREEEIAKKEKRSIDPERIDELTKEFIKRIPYKSKGCRYHSFVTYFSVLQKLGWVEPSGKVEPSAFQDNYSEGKARIYYHLTNEGIAASELSWANPHKALYG
jgi:hypothetical protein